MEEEQREEDHGLVVSKHRSDVLKRSIPLNPKPSFIFNTNLQLIAFFVNQNIFDDEKQ